MCDQYFRRDVSDIDGDDQYFKRNDAGCPYQSVWDYEINLLLQKRNLCQC